MLHLSVDLSRGVFALKPGSVLVCAGGGRCETQVVCGGRGAMREASSGLGVWTTGASAMQTNENREDEMTSCHLPASPDPTLPHRTP